MRCQRFDNFIYENVTRIQRDCDWNRCKEVTKQVADLCTKTRKKTLNAYEMKIAHACINKHYHSYSFTLEFILKTSLDLFFCSSPLLHLSTFLFLCFFHLLLVKHMFLCLTRPSMKFESQIHQQDLDWQHRKRNNYQLKWVLIAENSSIKATDTSVIGKDNYINGYACV